MTLGVVPKICIGWAVAVGSGLYAFVLSKRYIDSRRYENMKIREHKLANMDQLNMAKLQQIQDLELEMMADMYTRLTNACHKKCIAPKYKEAELGKGESVCIDRCVAKYLDIHERVGKKFTELSAQDEEFTKRLQAEQAKQPS